MEEFLQFVAKVLRVDRTQLSPDTSCGSISQWDSIMHLRLVMEIEEKYNVEIHIDVVPTIKKLSQFYEHTKRQ